GMQNLGTGVAQVFLFAIALEQHSPDFDVRFLFDISRQDPIGLQYYPARHGSSVPRENFVAIRISKRRTVFAMEPLSLILFSCALLAQETKIAYHQMRNLKGCEIPPRRKNFLAKFVRERLPEHDVRESKKRQPGITRKAEVYGKNSPRDDRTEGGCKSAQAGGALGLVLRNLGLFKKPHLICQRQSLLKSKLPDQSFLKGSIHR